MANITKKSKQSTALATFDAELEQYAQAAASTEQTPAGNFISTRAGILQVAGSPVKDNKLNAVIVDYVYENHLFEGKFNPDKPASPVCFAFGRTEEELAPHEKSAKPQAETCAACPNNVYGTAVDQDGNPGKGKACKNIRRLAIIPASACESAESVKDAETFYLKLPVTSVKGWAYYVKALANALKRPPFAVQTEVACVPDVKSQFKVTFQPGDTLAPEIVQAVMAKREEIADQLTAPYTPTPEEAAPAPAAKGRGAAKQPARKF